MKANIRFFLVLVGVLLVVSLAAQTVINPLLNNVIRYDITNFSTPVEQTIPVRLIEQSSENTMVIRYQFSGFNVAMKEESKQVFQYLHIKDFPKMGKVGMPALPAHNDFILIPGGNVLIEIIEAPYREYSGFNIYPALDDASDEAGKPEPEFVMDQNIYSTNSFWPSDIVAIEAQQKIRQVDYAVIQIRPIQYNPVTQTIRVYEYIKYRLVFSGDNQTYKNIKYSSSDRFLNSMKSGVLNGNLMPEKSDLSAKNSNVYDILVLTTPALKQAADTLIQWKRQLGHNPKLMLNSAWTSSAVMDSVHGLYNSQSPHPDYLIILGDHEDVPAQVIPYSTKMYYTDLYYVCMDGSADYLADMARGRISVNSPAQALSTVLKIVDYERNPIADPSFYNSIMSCGYFQDGSTPTSYYDGYADRRFLHTAEEIRSYLNTKNYSVSRTYYAYDGRNPSFYNNGYYSNGQAIPTDLLKSNGFTWSGNTADIVNKINAGAFIVYHRDHGYVDGYGWQHPSFLNQESSSLVTNGNNINQLNNGSKLPVMFSINCHTGDFRRPECFAENFLRKSNGGAVGVFAPSYESFSGYNDALIVGMFDAIWSNPGLVPAFGSGGTINPSLNSHGDMLAMGDVLNQGLLRMVQTWAVSSKWKMQNEIFHYFGDPSMKIWTSAPTIFSVSQITDLVRLDSVINISIANGGDANFTLLEGDVLIASGTLQNGQASISLSLDSIHQLILTVYKHNYRPFIKKIFVNNTVIPSAPVIQASNIRFDSQSSKTTSVTVSWEKGDGEFSMVVISDNGSFSTPNDGDVYEADNYYHGDGEQVVFRGVGNAVTVLNLNEGSVYWFRVYEYNNEGIYTLYQTIDDVDNPNANDGSSSLLPVELIEFSANYSKGFVSINWVTASEINNNYFQVERSIDNFNFEMIGHINGSGNSNVQLNYSFADFAPSAGINYYRLRQVDFDGKTTISEPISVLVNQSSEIFDKMIIDANHLGIDLTQTNATSFCLMDVSGKIINKFDENYLMNNPINLPISQLASGLYMISILANGKVENRKILIN